jgi:hypothetical protein
MKIQSMRIAEKVTAIIRCFARKGKISHAEKGEQGRR